MCCILLLSLHMDLLLVQTRSLTKMKEAKPSTIVKL